MLVKDDDHLVIHPADGLGGTHPVHVCHSDIHEDDVKVSCIALRHLGAVGEGGDGKMLPALLGKAVQIFGQLLPVIGVVLHQRDAYHRLTPPANLPC